MELCVLFTGWMTNGDSPFQFNLFLFTEQHPSALQSVCFLWSSVNTIYSKSKFCCVVQFQVIFFQASKWVGSDFHQSGLVAIDEKQIRLLLNDDVFKSPGVTEEDKSQGKSMDSGSGDSQVRRKCFCNDLNGPSLSWSLSCNIQERMGLCKNIQHL